MHNYQPCENLLLVYRKSSLWGITSSFLIPRWYFFAFFKNNPQSQLIWQYHKTWKYIHSVHLYVNIHIDYLKVKESYSHAKLRTSYRNESRSWGIKPNEMVCLTWQLWIPGKTGSREQRYFMKIRKPNNKTEKFAR